MARSRLEKIGTIYTRTRGLIESGALTWEDRPLWYDVYEAFPPKEEPRFDRPAPNIQLKKIFYDEDKIRALFQNRNAHIGTINMFNNSSVTVTKKFIEIYKKLDEQYDKKAPPEQLYEESIEMLQRERQRQSEALDEQVSLVSLFKETQNKTKDIGNVPINVKDIFKD